jgi:coenzyme F420-0:L-glutamate ligase/coenzyme F420-1:gamma-L-glutamate ligase
MTVEILPIEGIPEVEPGSDLADMIAVASAGCGLSFREGDVVAVTQKVVSKAEGRVVAEGPGGKGAWVDRETRRVVARRGDLVIAETRHGFVCANAGVDASNVAEGFLTLLPEDADLSAERIRKDLTRITGVDVAVIITDTFGRPWREGLVNVAIGCSGLPAVVDLRGTKDTSGRVLESTVVALADEAAAASGLVMGKAEGVPAAIVRGLAMNAPALPASALVRVPAEDLFRESPLQALHARRSIRQFGPGEVDPSAVREAIAAACTAPAPHHTRPWLFVALHASPLRTRLLDAMAAAWRADLEADGTSDEVIDRRLQRSDALLREAPMLVIPFVRLAGAHSYPDAERTEAEREMFLLSGGAAIQNLMLALHAQGLASCWVSSTLFCKEETREALQLEKEWIPLGSVAVGPPPAEGPSPRPPLDPEMFLRGLD